MDLIDKIIALLEAKFQGARKDVLTNLASSIALQVEDEESAKPIIDRMTAEGFNKFSKNYRSRIDQEVQKSNKTLEDNLREKYDFMEKGGKPSDPKEGTLTIDQVRQLMAETLQPIAQRMDAFDGQRQAASRRESYQAKLKESKLSAAAEEMLMSTFDRMQFKDDDEFNGFVSSQDPMIKKMAQEYADQSLRTDKTPSFGKTGDDGVSQAMKDYLAQKGKPGESSLGGKSL